MSLSIFPALLVFITMGVGWWIGDYNGVFAEVVQSAAANRQADTNERVLADLEKLKEPQRKFTIHFQLGLASSLAVVLINSLSVTYLIGTSRWVKEVCEAYGLDEKYVVSSTKLKRSTFPWSIMGVLSILAIIAFGAAADPGTLRQTTASWVTPHLIAAMVGSTVILIAIFVQATNLHENSEIIHQVVADVRKERQARGLPVE